MKIKTDFVTNSSTTVYLCYIPDDLVIDLEFIKASDTWQDYEREEGMTIEEFEDIVNSKLTEFRETNNMDEWDSWQACSAVREALEKRGCLIKSMDVGGGEGTYYVGLSDKDIDKIKKLKEIPDENQVRFRHK